MHLHMPVFLVMVVVLARPVVLLKCTYSPTPILLVVCVGVCFCFVFPQVPPFKILVHLNPSCNRLQSLIGKMNTNSGGGSSPSPGDYSKKKWIKNCWVIKFDCQQLLTLKILAETYISAFI
jgi:hypothetical protein